MPVNPNDPNYNLRQLRGAFVAGKQSAPSGCFGNPCGCPMLGEAPGCPLPVDWFNRTAGCLRQIAEAVTRIHDGRPSNAPWRLIEAADELMKLFPKSIAGAEPAVRRMVDNHYSEVPDADPRS